MFNSMHYISNGLYTQFKWFPLNLNQHSIFIQGCWRQSQQTQGEMQATSRSPVYQRADTKTDNRSHLWTNQQLSL